MATQSNTIVQDENDPLQVVRVAAQRQMYSDAKKLQAVQITLSVVGVVVWSVLVIWLPAYKTYAALWGVIASLLDVTVLNPSQKELKLQAARTQELFDTEVLQITPKLTKTGQPPVTEAITKYANKYRHVNRNNPKKLTQTSNWYSVNVAGLPLHLARLACQRDNCWWDGNLRRRYAYLILVIVIVIPVVLLVGGLWLSFSLETFVSGILAISPALIFGVRQCIENLEAARAVDHLRDDAVSLWSRALAGSITEAEAAIESRELQDEIFDHRRRDPLIPDLVYDVLRRKQEDDMNQGMQALVAEAQRALRRNSPTP